MGDIVSLLSFRLADGESLRINLSIVFTFFRSFCLTLGFRGGLFGVADPGAVGRGVDPEVVGRWAEINIRFFISVSAIGSCVGGATMLCSLLSESTEGGDGEGGGTCVTVKSTLEFDSTLLSVICRTGERDGSTKSSLWQSMSRVATVSLRDIRRRPS